jgi:hypothetical protein
MAAPNLNAGQFTIGPNCSVAIFQGGSELNLGLITQIMFSSKIEIEKKRINLMSGYTFILPFIQNWTGEITIQRTDNSLDSLWYNLFEAPVKAGAPYPTCNIIQTVAETGGGTTRFTFQGAALFFDDAGSFENEQGVVQKVSFSAPIRLVG